MRLNKKDKHALIALLAIIFIIVFICIGCSSPCKEYAQRNFLRASEHFPKYKALIDRAGVDDLEIILKLQNGSLMTATDDEIKQLKKVLLQEIDSWFIVIESEKEVQVSF